MHSLYRGIPKAPCPQSWTSKLQALNWNLRRRHVSDLASVPGHPIEEHNPIPVTAKIPSSRFNSFAQKASLCMLTNTFQKYFPNTRGTTSVEQLSLQSKCRKDPVRETSGIRCFNTSSTIEPEEGERPVEQAIENFQIAFRLPRPQSWMSRPTHLRPLLLIFRAGRGTLLCCLLILESSGHNLRGKLVGDF